MNPAMAVIRGRQLTRFDVAPDGEPVAIHVRDEHAGTSILVLERLPELVADAAS